MLNAQEFRLAANRIKLAHEARLGGRIAEALYVESLVDKAIFQQANGNQEDILVELQHSMNITEKDVDRACEENSKELTPC